MMLPKQTEHTEASHHVYSSSNPDQSFVVQKATPCDDEIVCTASESGSENCLAMVSASYSGMHDRDDAIREIKRMASHAPPGKLFGVWTKVERAKKHIADMNRAVGIFDNSGAYKIGTKHDPYTRKLIYYLTGVEEVPTEITQVASDAIGNLITALDHLAFCLYREHTPGGAGRGVQFPIARDATTMAKYKSSCAGKVKGIAPHVADAMFALEAYQGGKAHQLWVLNELNNLSKHRALIAVGSHFRSLNLGSEMERMMQKHLGSLPKTIR
jgi:hypothetical protein